MAKTLIAYFTWSGTCGSMAEKIGEDTGNDIFKIETVKPYPKKYALCVAKAGPELAAKKRPELKAMPQDTDHDTIMLIYPCWYGTCPMAVFTFLDGIDTKGVKIYPVCSNGGSGLGRSVKDLRKFYPDAEIKDGVDIRGAGEGAAAEAAKLEKYLAE